MAKSTGGQTSGNEKPGTGSGGLRGVKGGSSPKPKGTK